MKLYHGSNIVEFDEVAFEQLSIKRFEGYTEEWAEFVLANRRNRADEQFTPMTLLLDLLRMML